MRLGVSNWPRVATVFPHAFSRLDIRLPNPRDTPVVSMVMRAKAAFATPMPTSVGARAAPIRTAISPFVTGSSPIRLFAPIAIRSRPGSRTTFVQDSRAPLLSIVGVGFALASPVQVSALTSVVPQAPVREEQPVGWLRMPVPTSERAFRCQPEISAKGCRATTMAKAAAQVIALRGFAGVSVASIRIARQDAACLDFPPRVFWLRSVSTTERCVDADF